MFYSSRLTGKGRKYGLQKGVIFLVWFQKYNGLAGIRMTRHGREQVEAHCWRGLAVLSIDGTTIRVPKSDENRAHFSLPKNGGHRESAYPQARVVGLMALGAHFLLDLKIGAYTESEKSPSSGFDEHLLDHCVLVDDGRFYRHQQREEGAPPPEDRGSGGGPQDYLRVQPALFVTARAMLFFGQLLPVAETLQLGATVRGQLGLSFSGCGGGFHLWDLS